MPDGAANRVVLGPTNEPRGPAVNVADIVT